MLWTCFALKYHDAERNRVISHCAHDGSFVAERCLVRSCWVRSTVISVSVCLVVVARICQKPHAQNARDFSISIARERQNCARGGETCCSRLAYVVCDSDGRTTSWDGMSRNTATCRASGLRPISSGYRTFCSTTGASLLYPSTQRGALSNRDVNEASWAWGQGRGRGQKEWGRGRGRGPKYFSRPRPDTLENKSVCMSMKTKILAFRT